MSRRTPPKVSYAFEYFRTHYNSVGKLKKSDGGKTGGGKTAKDIKSKNAKDKKSKGTGKKKKDKKKASKSKSKDKKKKKGKKGRKGSKGSKGAKPSRGNKKVVLRGQHEQNTRAGQEDAEGTRQPRPAGRTEEEGLEHAIARLQGTPRAPTVNH